MTERFVKKMVCGIVSLAAVTVIVVGVITLRFAIYAPEVLNDIFSIIWRLMI